MGVENENKKEISAVFVLRQCFHFVMLHHSNFIVFVLVKHFFLATYQGILFCTNSLAKINLRI